MQGSGGNRTAGFGARLGSPIPPVKVRPPSVSLAEKFQSTVKGVKTPARCGIRVLTPFRIAVEIGEPERTYTVEPLEDPVPRELPVGPVEPAPAEPPVEEPIEPERV
jgi:hypothetical protein